MAGHSHWAQIKHKKAIADRKKSQLIAKLVNNIIVAGRNNPNPETNIALRSAIERAKENGVSSEVIERNLKKLQSREFDNLENLIMGAYFNGGIVILIKALTPNKNKTLGEIKHILFKKQAKFTEGNSVSWMFEEKYCLKIIKNEINLSEIFKQICEFIDDFIEDENSLILYTKYESYYNLVEILKNNNINIISTEIKFIPKNYVIIKDEKTKEKLNQLVDELLNHNDVYEVVTNVK
jgi:YebC/PmpR family DNA-binding regulatory protein